MKKLSLFFVGVAAVAMCGDAFAAVKNLTPKKAQAVAIQEDSLSTSSIGTSLLPSVIGLATNVIQINKEQKELSSKCEPTTSEIEFVNNMMKEWAMAGAENPIKSDSTKKCEGMAKRAVIKFGSRIIMNLPMMKVKCVSKFLPKQTNPRKTLCGTVFQRHRWNLIVLTAVIFPIAARIANARQQICGWCSVKLTLTKKITLLMN